MFTTEVEVFGKIIKVPIKTYADFKNAFGKPSQEELEDMLLASDAACKNYEESDLEALLVKELSWRAKPLTDEQKRLAIQRWIAYGKQ